MRIANARAAEKDLSGATLNNDYVDCHFNYAKLRDAHFEEGTFVRCDFSHADLRRSVVRLSCQTGSGNHIDVLNAMAYLYHFNHFFDLPPEIKCVLEPLLQPYKRKLAVHFSEET